MHKIYKLKEKFIKKDFEKNKYFKDEKLNQKNKNIG